MKRLTIVQSLAALALMAALPQAVRAEAFEIEENFDTSSSLPAGWSTSGGFVCEGADYFGFAAHSGSNMVATAVGAAGQTLFTPAFTLAADKEFTLEFAARLNGGNPPTVRCLGFDVYAGTVADVNQMTKIGSQEPGQLASWTELSFTLTPAEEGDYLFAVVVTAGPIATQAGGVFLDTFFFIGYSPEQEQPVDPVVDLGALEPNGENLPLCHELPEKEDFSDATHYSGGTLPTDWVTLGTAVWRTANIDDLRAKSGEYYMIAPESGYVRDETAYTPYYNLTAGVEYTVSFYSHMEGTQFGDELRVPTISVTLGTEQDSDFHTPAIYSVSRSKDGKHQWTQEIFTITPVHSGPYCLGFSLTGDAYSGYAAIDLFTITAPGLTPRPEPEMQIQGLFNYMNSALMSFEGHPVRLVNLSRYADSTSWSLPGASSVTELEDGSVEVIYPTDGTYSAELTATNARGSRTATVTFDVERMAQPEAQLPVMNYDPSGVNYLSRSQIPAFAGPKGDGLDFVSGFTHYYRTYAERYDLPEGDDFELTSVTMWLTHLRYCPLQSGRPQYEEPLIINVYGAKADGTPDSSKLLYTETTSMKEVYGSVGIGAQVGEPRYFAFANPVTVSGTIYVALEYSADMILDEYDANVGRTFLSLGMIRHLHGRTSIYVSPYDIPEGSTGIYRGSWYPVEVFDSELKGLGLNWQLWTRYTPRATSISEVTSPDVERDSMWYDLQGRSYKSLPAVPGVYIDANGHKQLVR